MPMLHAISFAASLSAVVDSTVKPKSSCWPPNPRFIKINVRFIGAMLMKQTNAYAMSTLRMRG